MQKSALIPFLQKQVIYLLYFAVPVIIGYLLGSIPFGYIVGKAHGIDITAEGSGSTGTTNALRLLGKKAAFLVLLGDFSKGVIAPIFSFNLVNAVIKQSSALTVGSCSLKELSGIVFTLAAFALLIGHSKSIWIGFKGGKSVASGVGTLFALDWRVGLITAIVWAIVVFTSKFSSLGALVAVPLSVFVMFIFKNYVDLNSSVCAQINSGIYVAYCFLGALYIVIKHKANIQRLMNGTEPKIGQKSSESKS